LFFGIQQAFEGFVWLGIDSNQINIINTSALCFLFFSHFFWLFWLPFTAYSVEKNLFLKKILGAFSFVGLVFGACLYYPLLIHSSLLQIQVIDNSIYYKTKFFFEDFVPPNFSWMAYILIILIPLFISSNRSFNFLGGLVFMAAIFSYVVFSYAFISVWCFFAAIVSIYLIYVVNQLVDFDSRQISSQ
jgi:hypothetical protein